MADLCLDRITVDTALAEEYLKKYNNFDEWPKSGEYWHVQDYPNKNVHIFEKNKFLAPDFTESERTSMVKGIQLAKKIEENEVLFSQLEYLLRKNDAVDVKNNIKLLSQHLQCYDEFSLGLQGISIVMTDKTPLYTLGCVASALNRRNWKKNVFIVTTQEVAPICHLFIELCAQVGWKIPLLFMCRTDMILDSEHFLTVIGAEANSGCTGVVTETADIDSALDVFVNSSVSAPWKIQRLYVQESIYEEVRSGLEARCSRERVGSYIDAFATKGKVFVCGAMETVLNFSSDQVVVIVEAYRTAKEVLALLAQQTSPFLSVWAADSALSHELATAATSTRVWINEYADFDGPPRACLPVYDSIYPRYYLSSKHIDTLTAWKKLTEKERVELMMTALQGHLASVPSDLEHIERLQDAILNRRSDGFVSVNANRICFGIESYKDTVVIGIDSFHIPYELVNFVIKGDGGVFCCFLLYDSFKQYKSLLESLEKAGVPVYAYNTLDDKQKKVLYPVILKKIKVVSTNFGTIFAN